MNEILTITGTMKAAETTLTQYCVAVHSASTDNTAAREVKRPAGTTADKIYGVLRDNQLAAGYVGAFQVMGIALVKTGAAVAEGDTLVISGVTGAVRPLGNPAVDAGLPIVGIAQEYASTSGVIIRVLLTIGERVHS